MSVHKCFKTQTVYEVNAFGGLLITNVLITVHYCIPIIVFDSSNQQS